MSPILATAVGYIVVRYGPQLVTELRMRRALLVWAVLGHRWQARQVNFQRIFSLALVLTALGLLGTFPPIFALFH